MTHYKQREIIRSLKDGLENMPIVVLSGMRQCGKSTLLQNDPILKKCQYLTFDDFSITDFSVFITKSSYYVQSITHDSLFNF